MERSLVILGTGGSAYDVLDIVDAINVREPTWHVAGFLDDGRAAGEGHTGLPVLGKLSDAARLPADCWFINAIGSDRSYRRRLDLIASTGIAADRFATLIHPGAAVSARAHLGRGVYVCFGASVGGAARLGDHVSLCPGTIVGHDAVLQAGALMAPGAVISGFVTVETCAYVGARAVVRQGLRVGEGALVGMGAAVIGDVAAGEVVAGVPAKPIRRAARRDAVAGRIGRA